MNRSDFYKKVVVDDVTELDFMNNPLSGFAISYEPQYYRVESSDLMRPEIISYKCYGSEEFWWVIMLVNQVDNPLLDLVIGQILTIPNMLDIYTFQKKFRIIT